MKSFIVVIIVSLVLGILENKMGHNSEDLSEEKFIMKFPKSFFWLGFLEVGMMAALVIWAEVTNQLEGEYYIVIFPILTAIPGFLLMIMCLTGVWEIKVESDDIQVIKFYILKKKFLFSEIAYCKKTRGGFKVYVKERKRKAFYVDNYMQGAAVFLKRVNKKGIRIEEVPQKR